MNKSVLAYVRVCPVCKTSYIPEIGEICKCPDGGDDEALSSILLDPFDDFPTEKDRQEDS